MPPSDLTRPADSSSTSARRATGAKLSRREQWLLLACVALAHAGIAATLSTWTPPHPQPEAAHVTVTLVTPAAPAPAPVPPAPAPAAISPPPAPVEPPTPAPAPTPAAPTPKAPAPPKPPKPAPVPAPAPAPAPVQAPAPTTPPSAPPAPESPHPTPAPAADTPLREPTPANVGAPPERIVEARYDAAYLNNPKPDYPLRSRRMLEQGRVLLRVFVTRDGRPDKVELSESSGYARLDRAAQTGVAQWRFVPARRGQDGVDSWIVVPIVYELEGN